jgi:hypothetical protein
VVVLQHPFTVPVVSCRYIICEVGLIVVPARRKRHRGLIGQLIVSWLRNLDVLGLQIRLSLLIMKVRHRLMIVCLGCSDPDCW